MASPLRLAVSGFGQDRTTWAARAEAAWTAVQAEFEGAEAEMSRFRDASDLTRLNRAAGTGEAVTVRRRAERALVAADRAWRRTDGRFDPRVLVDLERLGYRGASVGGPGIAGTRPTPGRAGVARIVGRPRPGRLCLDRPIDLGGIGKGLALRWGAAVVRGAGVEGFLLEAGGDLVCDGPAPEGGAWQVAIEDPAGGSEPLAAIVVEDGAVATSSVRRRHWVHEGRAVHHLLDPRTGEPARGGIAAVTVAGPDPAWSEVWSKALFIEGGAGIAALARARGLAAWWVRSDGTLEMTAAARQRTAWVGSDPAR